MRGTTVEHLSLISSGPVKSFWYCMDCEAITNQPTCAYCASVVVTPLEDLINRQSRFAARTHRDRELAFPNTLRQYLEGGCDASN